MLLSHKRGGFNRERAGDGINNVGAGLVPALKKGRPQGRPYG